MEAYGNPTQAVAPSFSLHSFGNGKVKRTKMKVNKTKDGKYLGYERVEVEEPAGELAQFPKGHSIRVTARSKKDAGLDKFPKLIDMTTGEEINSGPSYFQQMQAKSLEAMALPETSDAVVSPQELVDNAMKGDKS